MKNVFEKQVVGQSPSQFRHLKKLSTDSSNSFVAMGKETDTDFATDSLNFGGSFKKKEFSHIEEKSNLRKIDIASEAGDDMSDRVYTIDSIHQGASLNGDMEHKAFVGSGCDYYIKTHMESLNHSDAKDLEVQKLHTRLHALEADRESMKQTIISIRTDKAQLILLKEIAQNLCRDMSPSRSKPVIKPSMIGSFYFISVFKWIVSFVFWKRKVRRCKYMFGLSAKNPGLLMLLDQGSRVRQWQIGQLRTCETKQVLYIHL